ncbi:hypothetical protein BKA64DRAFT_372293 [Cadophora sp. MPI-SDFR-AT-0126]|nr:hypothetical protein BKA64DRAFT_372293 [Leotiomycetes sp. MPI-SDFR-AT-0126]
MSVQSFQSSSSASPSQPQTSNTICFLCRQRKQKCDRKLPKCGNCTKGKFDCHYVAGQKKRGLRAGYVAELEERIGFLEADVATLKQLSAESIGGFDGTVLASRFGTRVPIQEDRLLDTSRLLRNPQQPRVRSIEEMVDSWFTLYHPWFPILHRPSFLSQVKATEHNTNFSMTDIRLKAIIAVIDQNDQNRSDAVCNEVLMYAMKTIALPALQALLIVSLANLNSGHLSDFWKVVALCRNIGTQLGLRDLVSHYCLNYNQASVLAPRMLPLPNTFIEREERIRAYWMIECLDAGSTVGSAWNIGLLTSFPSEILPCSDEVWGSVNPDVSMITAQDKLSSFSLYVSLVTKELYRVHAVMQEPYDFTAVGEHERWLASCNDVFDELKNWREACLPSFFVSYGFDDEGRVKMDVNSITANIALDSSIIAMYQKRAFDDTGQIRDRCIHACNSIAAISNFVVSQAQFVGPHNLLGFFVAARFLSVHARIQRKPLQASFHSLLKYFLEASKDWHLAFNLWKVLYAAEREQNEELEKTALPPQFFDLRYSALDIYHALQIWALAQEDSG